MTEPKVFTIICPNCASTWESIGFNYQEAALDTMCLECGYEITEEDFITTGG